MANEANDCTSRREVTFATLLAGLSLGRSPHECDENESSPGISCASSSVSRLFSFGTRIGRNGQL